MKKPFPVFEIVEIENIPYLHLQFDKQEHLMWLSQNMICSEVSDGSSSHDYPTDLCVRIPLIAFVEAYTALDQYKHISQAVIDCSVSSDELAQAEPKCVLYHSRVIINKPDFDSREKPGVFVPAFQFSLAFADWYSDREWIVELNLAMLGLDEFVDNVGSLNALKHGLAQKSCKQTQKIYPIFNWFY